MQRQVNGIILLDKPINITSNGALQRLKRLFAAKKAGHTGSLDPIATGMLPICFGEATKFSQFLLESDKTYQVVAQLGAETTTGDCEGEVIAINEFVNITEASIVRVTKKFIGIIEQIPPMYSAIKHQGKPLYKLARSGISVERKPRSVNIFSLSIKQLDRDQLTFIVHCSKGTYVRTLVEDIGRELGCGAHVIELRRLSVTPYDNAHMVTLPELEARYASDGYEGLSSHLLPIETAVQVFPMVQLSTAAIFYLRTGQAVRINTPLNSSLVRLTSEDGKFLGVGEVMPDGRVKPNRLIS